MNPYLRVTAAFYLYFGKAETMPNNTLRSPLHEKTVAFRAGWVFDPACGLYDHQP